MVLLNDECESLLEVKHEGRHAFSKFSAIPNVYAQTVGALHSLAIAKIIK